MRDQGSCAKCAGQDHTVFYVVVNDEIVKPGVSSGTGIPRIGNHRRSGLTETVRLLSNIPDAKKLEDAVLKTLKLARVQPVRGREYFPVSALATILDIVDNWS